jgi:hypothetical protein
MHLPERHRAGLLPLLIVDEHRGQGAPRNLEVVAPHEKAFSPFGALPGSGDVVHDPVAPRVYGSQKFAVIEGIEADVALGEEPTNRPGEDAGSCREMSFRPARRPCHCGIDRQGRAAEVAGRDEPS